MILRKTIITVSAALMAALLPAQELNDYLPDVYGTFRGKYEYNTVEDDHLFQVRNARVGLQGEVGKWIDYKAEVDLSDRGKMRTLDAWVGLSLIPQLKLTCGQMRAPFGIDMHRGPHKRYFANRSFIYKKMCNNRDVGVKLGFKPKGDIPFIFDLGLFSGSGITDQTEAKKNLIFSGRLQYVPCNNYNLTLSMQRTRPSIVNVYTYGLGSYYEFRNWHIEAEGIYTHYANHAFGDVWGVNSILFYNWWFKQSSTPLERISFLGRYEYMDKYAKGKLDEDGKLAMTDDARQRITGGVTLGLNIAPCKAEIRFNYEKYLYHDSAVVNPAEQDKLVVELMVRF